MQDESVGRWQERAAASSSVRWAKKVITRSQAGSSPDRQNSRRFPVELAELDFVPSEAEGVGSASQQVHGERSISGLKRTDSVRDHAHKSFR